MPNGTTQLGVMDAKGNARLANKYGEFVVSAPKDSIIIITKDSNDIRNERASGGYILQVAGENGYSGEMDRMYSPEVFETMDEYRESHEVEKDSNESDGSYEVKKANTDVLPGALGLGSLLEGMLSSGSAVGGFGVIYIPIPDKVRVEPNTSEDAPRSDHKTKQQGKDIPTSGGLPTTGDPNSSTDLLDENGDIKQRRYYDEKGRVEKDIDYKHQDDGTHTFPHEHNWDWTNPSKPIRSR
jgi:hypothetical protein